MQRTLSEPITPAPEPAVLVEPAEAVSTEDMEPAAKPAKKAKREPEEAKRAKKEGKGEPKPTRGPARPYRKLSQEILDSRIQKLQKRLTRTTSQAEEAGAFLSKYVREQDFRKADLAKAAVA